MFISWDSAGVCLGPGMDKEDKHLMESNQMATSSLGFSNRFNS